MSRKCRHVIIYDRELTGNIAPPFSGYLFTYLPGRTASYIYTHCISEFPNIIIRYQPTPKHIQFL